MNKINFKENRIFYLAGAIVILGIKYFYSSAGANELRWILAPTTWCVRILSGIPFYWESRVGYVSHELRYIIAPSCSGVQFMLIAFAMLVFCFVHRMGTTKRRCLWFLASAPVAYLLTVFVNGVRIILSIYLRNIGYGRLTPDRLHTVLGTVVFFAALLVIYHAANYICRHGLSIRTEKGEVGERTWISPLPPLLCYFSIALGIPFFNMAFKNEGFTEYAVLVTAVCLIIYCCILAKNLLYCKK